MELTDGTALPADTVIMAVGDQPDLSFLPEEIKTERGFIAVDERYQTSDPKVYAVGDAVRLGLLTEAIGAGRVAARAIDDLLRGREDACNQVAATSIRSGCGSNTTTRGCLTLRGHHLLRLLLRLLRRLPRLRRLREPLPAERDLPA